MFNSSQKSSVDTLVLKCDYISDTPPLSSLVKGENNQTFIDIPIKDSAISLKVNNIEFDFILTLSAGGHAR